jgi:Kef-type K+ transport system membrane component KefB
MSMKKNTFLFIIRIIIDYIFFIFGCYFLDKQALFEVLLPNFNKAPESSFLFFVILLFITVSYIYKLYKIRRMK